MGERPDIEALPTRVEEQPPSDPWSGSILFRSWSGDGGEPLAEPSFFGDLNLDQVCAALTTGREEYNLAPFFYQALRDVESVELPPRRSTGDRA